MTYHTVYMMQIESLLSANKIITELLGNGYIVKSYAVYKEWPSDGQIKYWQIEYWKREEKITV